MIPELALPDGWRLDLRKKSIRHIYFRIQADKKRVLVSAPLTVSSRTLEQAVRSKAGWIRQKIDQCRPVPSRPCHSYTEGEIHQFLGEPYCLKLGETCGKQQVVLSGGRELTLLARPGSGREKREALLNRWFRDCLQETARWVVADWEPVMGVRVRELRVRKMKTRWGSCNTAAGRIWLNLALVHTAPRYLEYVVVHEMVHLLERYHNKTFYAYMDRFLPGWTDLKARLNRFPL